MGGRKVVVKDNDVSRVKFNQPFEFFDFTFADVGSRVWFGSSLRNSTNNNRAGSFRKPLQLTKRIGVKSIGVEVVVG